MIFTNRHGMKFIEINFVWLVVFNIDSLKNKTIFDYSSCCLLSFWDIVDILAPAQKRYSYDIIAAELYLSGKIMEQIWSPIFSQRVTLLQLLTLQPIITDIYGSFIYWIRNKSIYSINFFAFISFIVFSNFLQC